MDLDKWAFGLQREVYEEWENKFRSWTPGFKVFYGPIRFKPNLLILSLQPGGGENHFLREDRARFEANDFSVQKYNSYIESDGPMARGVKNVFLGNMELLNQSVIVPLIFFRARNYELWKKFPLRKRMEQFSYEKIKEIIETIEPQELLIFGIKTYEKLKEVFPVSDEHVIYRRGGLDKGERVMIGARIQNIPVIVMIHPSGARISLQDREHLRELFESR